KPPPPKPPPAARPAAPRAVARAPLPSANPTPAPVRAAPAPQVVPGLTLSNDDAPGGIAIPVRAPQLAKPPPPPLPAAPSTARRQRDDLRTGIGDCDEPPSKPEPVFKPDIEYTGRARADGIEGRLVLRLTIGADGAVRDVAVVSAVDSALDAAAVATVQ